MTYRPYLFALALISASFAHAQSQATIYGDIIGKGGRPKLAVSDFKGTGASAAFMSTFNGTLFSDLQKSGLFDMASKSFYPQRVPYSPQDFHPSGTNIAPEWSGPPVNASHLAFGYAADQGGTLVVYGYLFDLHQTTIQGAQAIAKRYFESMNDDGARKAAHEFANDIIAFFGGGSLTGTKIYFVSNRTGNEEIWVMDYDGSNQHQVSHNRGINITPAVSPDGSLVAFTSYRRGRPQIDIMDAATGRLRTFLNPDASVNANPAFSPDGQVLYFASSLAGPEQIYRSSITGGGLKRISQGHAIETEPKVNPKNPNQILFVSGRTGPEQVFIMNSDGLDIRRLTDGTGEASNPCWHLDGQHILFSWTRGYAKGDWNVFLMDVASGRYDQLTHSEGRNENPVWAPDGRHLVFGSNRSGSYQIWTMLADGTALTRLTNQGQNKQPVWSK